ncbi:MAG: lamin tail domain-containing protein [Sedimentisphaerales bacterium]|nr:lamin tail domain-containing protein [Sedimentisphaerales bacterium]
MSKSLILSIIVLILMSLSGFVHAEASPNGLPNITSLADETIPTVVINEIHYNPDIATELVEFIELHNFGSTDINLSGWYFSDGISYSFPMGSVLPAGGYIIVVQSPAHFQAKWNSSRGFFIQESLIYGPFEFSSKLENSGEKVELCDANGRVVDEVDYQLGFPWPIVGDAIPEDQPGTGSSIQLINPMFDNDLGGSWRSAYPTPAAENISVYAANIPPHIRQVEHTPLQPRSDEIVTITAKVTDSDGVADVSLVYQVVEPGNYINLTDGQYGINWTSMAMNDGGHDGDEIAGDDIYTVQMPSSMQVHRRLIRYRIIVRDRSGQGLRVPYPDDPQPNFAYFVYDGVPAWRGAIQPGVTPIIEFGTDVMRSLPVYHLISRKSDVETATWLEKYGGSDYKWYGTLVYDGQVYDHIRYRMRGGVWRYAMGKHMWKFNFNRGHRFQARDDYGKKYKTKWDKLNFSACIQQGSFGQRGEHGMFEALSNKLFNMAGVPTSKTHYLQFRVIDEQYEDGTFNAAHSPLTSNGTQYDGDFWGVYLAIEQMDGRFLDEHDLPDGNLYKMDGAYEGGAKLNNQGPTGATDKSDVFTFRNNYNSASSADVWGSMVNLDAYYGLYAIYNAVHHGDITSKNHFFYLNPEPTTNKWGSNNLWWQLVWDVDLTWTCYYGSMSDPFSRSGVLNHSETDIDCRNRVREIIDLLFNPEQTNQLIDEFAAVIDNPDGGVSIVDADRAMWDYHWVMGDGAYSRYINQQASFKAGQGRFYEEAEQRGYTRSFEGMVRVMKDFVVERQSYMDSISRDSAIPNTPTVTATCPPAYPINGLTFETGPFSDPQGSHTFSAMNWRIAEVNPGSEYVPEVEDKSVVLIEEESEWKYFKGTQEPSGGQDSWRQINFNDSSWLTGRTVIGYGESFIETDLSDMRGNYSTVYLRKTFDIANVDEIETLTLQAKYDDGVNIWINGVHVVSGNTHSAELGFDAVVDNRSENHSFSNFVLADPKSYLVNGTNVVAVQVINSYLSNSSDCFIDVRLYWEPSEEQEPPSTPRIYNREPGKYEMDAVWESGEITQFDSNIQIPASVINVGDTYRVRCRMKDNSGRWGHWSEPVQFVAGEPLSAGILENLRITEVMYNPAEGSTGDYIDNNEFEFIELKNIGDETIDLTYVSFVDGISFDFSLGGIMSLLPGEFVLVVKDEAAFVSRYGSSLSDKIAGEYSGSLSNSGERITLEDFWNGVIVQFEYKDGRGWPLPADGGGHSLVPLEVAILGESEGSLNYGGNLRASAYIGGSPGQDDPDVLSTVVVNEIAAHTNYNDPQQPEYNSNDWIELYNTTGTSINLQNWYLSDDIDDLKKWAITGIDIAGDSRISFDELNDFHNPISSGFGLSKAGEVVVLSYLPGNSEDRVVDYIRFKGQDNEVSLGRYPDGQANWFVMPMSRDTANAEPILNVVINEIMYHPLEDDDEEYIELYNPTAETVYLENSEGPWRLDGAVNYTFPSGVSMAAESRLIVVGFDPVIEIARLNAFIAAYNTTSLTGGVQIVGPWAGSLSNSNERISLEYPLTPDEPGQPLCWVISDEVIYADVAPWPETADGTGDCLQRIFSDQYHSGNSPANWQAAYPTPGSRP